MPIWDIRGKKTKVELMDEEKLHKFNEQAYAYGCRHPPIKVGKKIKCDL